MRWKIVLTPIFDDGVCLTLEGKKLHEAILPTTHLPLILY